MQIATTEADAYGIVEDLITTLRQRLDFHGFGPEEAHYTARIEMV